MNKPADNPADDARIARTLTAWFADNARDLPWRTQPRDPYHALVSEMMLQQTQVARVVEKFEPFLARFPTVRSLADAPEDEVLAAWSGLGYYRRARLLHACAKAIVQHHDGAVPDKPHALLALPGIGRYTAGAIASIVFNQPAPIVDGNVTRVLLRLHNKPIPQSDKATVDWAWHRADELVHARDDPAAFNEAIMELGATVCTPKAPRCPDCPIRTHCRAHTHGTTESIPLPKPKTRQKHLHCASIAITHRGRVILTQRPSAGMWASMYQLPTLERDDRQPTPDEITRTLALPSCEPVGSFTHATTHRIVEFTIYHARKPDRVPQHWIKHPIGSLQTLAISNAQMKAMRIAGILE